MADRGVLSASELKAQIEAQRAGVPFVVWSDGEGCQQLLVLSEELDFVTVGRGEASDIWIDWDTEVSRLHAELSRAAGTWTVSDDGLSRNGTHVNGARVLGRQRLVDGDVIRFGRTVATFHQPRPATVTETDIAPETIDPVLTDAQRRVLLALCRPFKETSGYVTPATNTQIAAELYLSADAVKTHLRALFGKFGIEQLPQNQKRVRLVELALKTGIISPRDL
jgi:pSer/pThr/pTyr-binding forkhead associated (FHA) protein